MSIETVGTQIDTIEVKISYRIIELFSGGLYSSPNKAFEELVCNSYDAFADTVCVHVPSDLTVEGAFIWVCDNGESMDQQGLKDLWKIGWSPKRIPEREERRLQIGRFGIGKLATYVLARKLTHICKKDGRYLATTMDYGVISEENEKLALAEREISEKEAEETLSPYIYSDGKYQLQFSLFGNNAVETWTFALLTELKPKAFEIKEGRLKWVLETALPLNPGFKLYYNGNKIESSKISMPIKKTWVLGKNDPTAEKLGFAKTGFDGTKYYIDFDNLKGVHGQIDLYVDSLDKGKSAEVGRSHGIFLIVRGRLINLDDALLGMPAFSHGPFNRTRIVLHADGLDDNLTSTRESIKESLPLTQLKSYIQKKFDNEVKKYYFEEENKKDRESSISYRLSQTSLTLSKRPLYVFAEKFYNNEIENPILIEKPPLELKVSLLKELQEELSGEESIIKKTDWLVLGSGDPIAKFDLTQGLVKINLLHPFIANYTDAYKSILPLEFVAITEVLTEAHLYELNLDESIINDIMRSRDNTLRKLSLSDRQGIPAVAQMLKESISDPTGLEEAVYNAFLALGFEASKIGGNDKPDGKADAILGYDKNQNNNYSLTYDAKSTQKDKIAAGTARLSAIKRHQTKYGANYSVVVAVDFEGANDPASAISMEAKQQKVTIIRARDLMRLLLLWAPHQIGFSRLRDLFENRCAPADVTNWIDEIEEEKIKTGPFKEVLEAIYHLQKTDIEPPDLSSVRYRLNETLKCDKPISKTELLSWIASLKVLIPGFISLEGEKVGVQGRPDVLMKAVHSAIQNVPNELQQKYLSAFCLERDGKTD
jgi:hypothetical protein